MAKAKWHKLPAFTIPLFQSAQSTSQQPENSFSMLINSLAAAGMRSHSILGLQATMKTLIRVSDAI